MSRVGANTGRIPAVWRSWILAGAALLFAGTSPSQALELPMYFLETFGPKGNVTATLTWGLLILSIVVVVTISLMVLYATIRRTGSFAPWKMDRILPVSRPPGGIRWIFGGLGVTALILVGFTIWTVDVMADIDRPPSDPVFTIEVTGQQWWWEARYLDGNDPSREFETANELHIPVGKPVRIRLLSPDVIHSFWVPALAGKLDVIPGQVNETWIQADHPGVFRGQCAEYCGEQHAHMALRVFADPPADFQRWWDAQLAIPDAPPEGTLVAAGQQRFQLRCGACHTVRGTLAQGEMGPDLTHLMSRSSIAAVTLPNTIGHLSGWISDPQQVKPGNHMPNLELSGPELQAIRAYLMTLD
ncbi:cytochrome c oxidase subunit II [Aurantimonas sp. HBX-1]|uniref:cytochrome c oxidase subunit II n=1 Tax=Aurantimonas sp. HBX-1 TaxID=2906072 RepID=UPI001F36BF76|nr:cytochrome c oxidase subunit II [Aurantimonas sp. HBX-1]UIJ71013.1 cytochrome c oxidase subunit II [Aurantimonas sp. HBX-1]